MSDAKEIQPSGDKIRKAVLWISETVQNNPGKKRLAILQEAQIKFDLSPRECEFVESKLSGNGGDTTEP
jgi:hypothetical protein